MNKFGDRDTMIAILAFQVNSPMFINLKPELQEKLVDLWRRKFASSLTKTEAVSLYEQVSAQWKDFGDTLVVDNLQMIKKVIS